MEQIYHFSDQLGSVDCIPCLGKITADGIVTITFQPERY